jgi:KipI family sensor histidine kinase inhibitor
MPASPVASSTRTYGDAGLLVEFTGGDREARWRAAHQLGLAIRSTVFTATVEVVASFDTVLVTYDPLVMEPAELMSTVASLHGVEELEPQARAFTVPVVYGGEFGPDLPDVAALLDLTPKGVVDLHTSEPWVVRLVGSPAGAPLMEGPSVVRAIPRLASPRVRVEPGSLGMSGGQSIVYNAPSPGGWRLIGRTPLTLFDAYTPPHVAYRPGDRLSFRPVDVDEWPRWAGRPLTVPTGP